MFSYLFRGCGFLGFLALAACGSGGNGPIIIGGGTPTAEKQLLAFVTADGDLKTIDPASPTTTVITVDTGLDASNFFSYRTLLNGTYVSSANALDDANRSTIAYVKQGQVFRLNLLKEASNTPVPVSSLTDACEIDALFYDYADPGNTRLVVETKGMDGNCASSADNEGRYLRLDADTATAGTSIVLSTFRIRESIYGTDGSLQAVLVQEGPSSSGVLRRYSANLLNPTTVANLEPGSLVDFGGPEPSRTSFYFRLRVAGLQTCLHRYDSGSNQLTSCLHAFAASNGPLSLTSEGDATHTYFADGGRALRIAHNEGSAIPIRDAGANIAINQLRLSPGRVVLNGVDNGTGVFRLETVPRAGGAPVFLQSGTSNAITLSEVASNRIYYTVDTPSTPGNDTYAALDDGSGQLLFPKAGWGGFSASTDRVNLGLTNLFMDVFHGVLGQAGPSPSSVDVTASSFDAQTGEALQTLGTIPYASSSISYAFGRYRLTEVMIYRPDTFLSDTDVYFADTLTGGSLLPLAQTPGLNDRVVF